ncbi:MAG: hypothetical protein ACLUH5_07555 [Eubacterium sp.]|uniref:hypothetical protein n=1 Tax=Eubacterium sp. TaxID=142586 RepID=UPI003A169D53
MNEENFDNYVSDEDRKGKIFAICLVVFLIAAIGLIVGFSLANRTTDEEVQSDNIIGVSDITEKADETEKTTSADESENSQSTSNNAEGASADGNNSLMTAEMKGENSRYETEVANINKKYDDKIKTQQGVIDLIENTVYGEEISGYESKIAEIDKAMQDVKDDPAYTYQLEQSKAEYQKMIDETNQKCKNECAPYESEISNLEKQRKAELDEARKTHEKNLQNISDKHK